MQRHSRSASCKEKSEVLETLYIYIYTYIYIYIYIHIYIYIYIYIYMFQTKTFTYLVFKSGFYHLAVADPLTFMTSMGQEFLKKHSFSQDRARPAATLEMAQSK